MPQSAEMISLATLRTKQRTPLSHHLVGKSFGLGKRDAGTGETTKFAIPHAHLYRDHALPNFQLFVIRPNKRKPWGQFTLSAESKRLP